MLTLYQIFFAISRLDQILGKQGSKAKDVYASKISLASRIVKVERQVNYTVKKNIYIRFINDKYILRLMILK